ncbi:HAD-IIIA family hydrolase [Marinomonas sp. C2222]|uniref:3-deoxy-D-manno-octulosonate 8-phosphate phosphatase KdsC n=2 Tax=Marinomonas sargassi TaxID=2984494 RepID=A0ABT2YVH4_9GAMM|nr:HAD-IIIA family hydrolase [Marinomonas sargassi]
MDLPFLSSYSELSDNKPLMDQFSAIKLVVFDVDGVLTDGRLLYTSEGETIKSFNVKDGVAMKLLPKWGVKVAVITAKDSLPLRKRMQDLNVEHFYPGCHNKAEAFADLTSNLGIAREDAAYVGDDVIDLQVMPHVGLSFCPEDAHVLVKRHCSFALTKGAGQGVAREVADLLLASRMTLEEAYELAQKPEFEK